MRLTFALSLRILPPFHLPPWASTGTGALMVFILQVSFADCDSMLALHPDQITWRLIQDIPDEAVVNLALELPARLQRLLPAHRRIRYVENAQLAHCIVFEALQVSQSGEVAGKAASPEQTSAPLYDRLMAMMPLFDAQGRCQLMEHCTMQAAMQARMVSLYTDLAVFDIRDNLVVLRELVEGITLYSLQAELDVEFTVAGDLRLLHAPSLSGG